jgi:hypothetical protein
MLRDGAVQRNCGWMQLTAAHDCELWPRRVGETKRSEGGVAAIEAGDGCGEGAARRGDTFLATCRVCARAKPRS